MLFRSHAWIAEALKKPVIDHYWQTETGWPILSSVPGVEPTPIKYGSPSFPVFGYDLKLLREADAAEAGADEKAVVAIAPPLPPGCMTTVWGDDERFVKTYFSDFGTKLAYSTFDSATRDRDGYYFVLGRTDDVINVAGHRLGTAEVESALVAHTKVSEAAVVGYPHDIKGQGIYAYVTLMTGEQPSEELRKELVAWVRKEIGPIASPDLIQFAPGLPKTRSGKIMRRILRKIAEDEYGNLGDTSTLADPTVVDDLVNNRQNKSKSA